MMSWPALAEIGRFAQFAAGRMLNGVAEGTVLAAGVWILLRAVRRTNSSSRFAVWFAVLLAMAALPLCMVRTGAAGSVVSSRSWIALPGWWAFGGLAIWAAIASVLLVRVGAGFRQVLRLRRECTAVDLSRLDPGLQKTLAEFQRFRPVDLCTSDKIKVPSAIGFSQPAVIVPSWTLRELSAEELHSVVLHELAHLRRRDDWTNLVQEVLGALLFFHPAVWWIGGRLSLEREMACDDLVLAQTANPRAYAQCLVSVAEKSFLRRGLVLAQAAVSRMRHTSLRVAQILDRNRPGAIGVWKPAVGLVGVFTVACLMAFTRAPQLVAFRSDAPAAGLEASIAPARTSVLAPATERETAAEGHSATVVPALWKTDSAVPARAARRTRQASHKPVSKTVLARAEGPRFVGAVNFVVELPPDVVMVVVQPHDCTARGSVVWHVEVYELTVFHPAGNTASQPSSAKI